MKKKVLITLLLVITIITSIFSTVYATDEQVEIPSKYDLRNDINIKVENQKDKPWCGAYSEIKMIETYIQKTKGIDYDLSEGYATHRSEFGGTYGKYVLESDFPTKDYKLTEANQKKFNEATSKAVIENFEYAENISKDEETLKRYIMNYGGVFISTSTCNQWHNYKGGIYRSEPISANRVEHGVIVIGWDDNYSKDNFVYEKPSKDGAWLILNSWGTNWGNNGTAWVSYEDYYNVIGNSSYIKGITLSNNETIKTEYTTKQDKIKKLETQVIEQETIEPNKTSNTYNIFIIVFAVAVILLIIGIILKSKKHK